jgi:hypothetical protein
MRQWTGRGVLAVAVIGLVAVAALAALQWVPHWIVHNDGLPTKDRLALQNDVRQAAVQLLAVLGAAVGGAVAIRTYALNRQTAITARLQQAVEDLESDKVSRRVGGILALERVARDSRRDHWPIIELLAAHLAEVAARGSERAEAETAAIARALRRRRHQRESEKDQLRLVNLDLHGVDLRGAHLERAVFSGTDLHGAYLKEAFLARASFTPNVSLEGAFLEGADLRAADLGGAGLVGADLRRADLRGTKLSGADWGGQINAGGAKGLPSHLSPRLKASS